MNLEQRKIVRVLFDEYHSESWTTSWDRAREMDPENPEASSYQEAARLLASREFVVQRNTARPLDADLLGEVDLLVLPHPCDPKWEATTSTHSPRLSVSEMQAVRDFVERGGGLMVISEYEHEKYGNNLNELMEPYGLKFENTTVEDALHAHHGNDTWVLAESLPAVREVFGHRVHQACFYRSSSITVSGSAAMAWRAREAARPSGAGLVGVASPGNGRVVAVGDSSLFGDRHIHEFDHVQLWLNLAYWCSNHAFHQAAVAEKESVVGQSVIWQMLKAAVNELRLLQKPDGSVEPASQATAGDQVEKILHQLRLLREHFPHQGEYFQKLGEDLEGWMKDHFPKPDFAASLAAYLPQLKRQDQLENLVLFPLYTPNASKDIRFEALLLKMPWPAWLEQLEREKYPNAKFAPGHLVDFTEGYRSECAVLFPETVSVREKATNHFATIFCDREARRLQSYTLKAASIVHLELHPQLDGFLHALPVIQDTLALWDLIHDQAHSTGELPFDPFMIRQRAPFWMYALEELRVDLKSFAEATRLSQGDFPFAHHVTYAILFDRIFRFPITGTRVKNYDGLGGQLLFSYLHQKDVLTWSDNRLGVRWDSLAEGVSGLREEILGLYKHGTDSSRVSFWIEAHDLISRYVKPNVGSHWKKESRLVADESDVKPWLAAVHDDEFPLGSFHTHLLARMRADQASAH